MHNGVGLLIEPEEDSNMICFVLREGRTNQNQEARILCICRSMKEVIFLCKRDGFVPGKKSQGNMGLFINKDLDQWRRPDKSEFVDFESKG